jgi:HSP20 family protein
MTIYVTPFGRIARRNLAERMMREPEFEVENRLYFPVDLREQNDAYELSALLPGVSADDLDIQVVNETVTITGELRNQRDEKSEYLLAERPAGRFARTLTLPMPVDAEKTEATLRDGILTLRIPKAESVRPRTIKVSHN